MGGGRWWSEVPRINVLSELRGFSARTMVILWICTVGIPFGFSIKAYAFGAWVQFGVWLGVAVTAAFVMFELHRRRGEV